MEYFAHLTNPKEAQEKGFTNTKSQKLIKYEYL